MARNRTPRIEQVLTVGVEEEFLLVDRVTRVTVPRCPEVQDAAARRLGDRVDHELYATQIEAHTRPADRVRDLRSDLVEARQVLAEAAQRAGCLLVASGSAVLTSRPLPITDDPRYLLMVERYQAEAARIDSEASGCHVHLGALNRDEAVELGGHLRPWLPVLQALAANSPFAAGDSHRVASRRYWTQQAWPTVGPAPLLSAAGYESAAEALVTSGQLMDRKMIYWYSRPSEHVPTLEVRVPDVSTDVDVTVLIAALTRALGTTLLAEMRDGLPAPEPTESEMVEAHRQAATHGLAGTWTHPVSRTAMSLSGGLRAMVEHATPALELVGEAGLVRGLLRWVAGVGTGDQRQRAVYQRRGRLLDVVDDLAVRTMAA